MALTGRGEDWSQTLLTVLAVPSRVALILIILPPARPSRRSNFSAAQLIWIYLRHSGKYRTP
jgi:hypothetical protein